MVDMTAEIENTCTQATDLTFDTADVTLKFLLNPTPQGNQMSLEHHHQLQKKAEPYKYQPSIRTSLNVTSTAKIDHVSAN